MKSVVVLWTMLSVSLLLRVAAAQDITKAKQEGRVIFYTSWGPGDVEYVVKAFEKKYAPLRVETVRASSERTLTRLLNEQRANTFLGDVVAVSGLQSGILKEKGALDRYQSPEAANFPPDWRDPDGLCHFRLHSRRRSWQIVNEIALCWQTRNGPRTTMIAKTENTTLPSASKFNELDDVFG